MVIFTSVVAEISSAVVGLLPDWHVDSHSNTGLQGSYGSKNDWFASLDETKPTSQFNIPSDKVIDSRFARSVVSSDMDIIKEELHENTAEREKSLNLEGILMASTLDDIMSNDTSKLQGKAAFLEWKITSTFPNVPVRVVCAEAENIDVLRVCCSWQNLLHIHEWLENLVKDVKAKYNKETKNCKDVEKLNTNNDVMHQGRKIKKSKSKHSKSKKTKTRKKTSEITPVDHVPEVCESNFTDINVKDNYA